MQQAKHSLVDLKTTVCPFCGIGCGLVVEDGQAFPLRSHPITEGALSLRGWSTGELLWSPLRLKTAFVRTTEKKWQPTEVPQALQLVAERLKDIHNRYGGEVIGVLGSARLTNEENRLLRQLAVALATPNLDSFQRMGYLPLPSCELSALDRATTITVLGVDLAHRHPQAFRRVSRALQRGATVRFVDYRQVQFARMATEHLRPLPGCELNEWHPNGDGEVVLVSSELAWHGQGSKAAEVLRSTQTLFLTDYVNQRGMIEAGIRPFPDGASAYEMLLRALTGDIKALLIFADDPFEFFPELAAEALQRLELLVVTDAVKTDAMRFAHVVLPGALLAEKEGTVTNCEGQKLSLAPVAAPPSGWTEKQLLEQLFALLGESPEENPVPPFTVNSATIKPEEPTDEFPFLIALDSGYFWNNHALVKASVTAWREMRRPFVDFPKGFVTINPEDARELNIRMLATVRVEGKEGEITLTANLDSRAGRGTLLVPMFLWERVGKALGALQLDPCLRIPIFRPTAVKVVRL